MDTELIKKLLEAGVHFGHQTKRWNPKMKPFIFGERRGVYIIDLEQTADNLVKAADFLKGVVAGGEYVLFVGTKRQAQEIIKAEAIKCKMFYVNRRWPGGMLTNFQTVTKSVDRLKELNRMKEDGTFNVLSKKEVSMLNKEIEKLSKNFFGILNMERLPKAMFVIDSRKEETAIREANKLGIPVVALVDTNCNPDIIDYIIPGNDDALKSISFITAFISNNTIEGRKKLAKKEIEVKKKPDEADKDEKDEVTTQNKKGDKD